MEKKNKMLWIILIIVAIFMFNSQQQSLFPIVAGMSPGLIMIGVGIALLATGVGAVIGVPVIGIGAFLTFSGGVTGFAIQNLFASPWIWAIAGVLLFMLILKNKGK